MTQDRLDRSTPKSVDAAALLGTKLSVQCAVIAGYDAAPSYFPPEVIQVGKEHFIFMDGGVTIYNNPIFQLFLMATVKPYNLKWPTGENQMFRVSIGTGTNPNANLDLEPREMNLIYNAALIPSGLMFAASNEQDFLYRVFGKCLAGDELDREVGDLCGMCGPVSPKPFTYVRYNPEFSREGLDAHGPNHIHPRDVQRLDSVDRIAQLQEVGRAIAKTKVKSEHFRGFL